ncbi:MAG: transaldolase [Chloroflexi bacterium]|nr:transaldolase [Anaerolineaceae bacterium]NMB86984.1 transaldolase [Chloroflexota bacterium]
MNTVQQLRAAGQSVWYDNIERRLINNGELEGMVKRGEILGLTSNPTIFKNAIVNSNDYDESLAKVRGAALSDTEVFFTLAIEDICSVAQMFRPVYDESQGLDGMVSLEVNPDLAYETQATLEEAKNLWKRVNQPNLMVKIPATQAGLPAITEAIAAGINVNVTLIFSLERYAEVIEAFLSGLEKRAANGQPLDHIASVASFFVSRIDTKVDPRLAALAGENPKAGQLAGKAAIANASLAYRLFQEQFGSSRFEALKHKGARVQRPLWASTSTKNPEYRDTIYVEELIAPHTVNTMPEKTLKAFLDHGKVEPRLEENIHTAEAVFSDLESLGISMAQVTEELEKEGVSSFSASFRDLVDAIHTRRQA